MDISGVYCLTFFNQTAPAILYYPSAPAVSSISVISL